MGISGIGPDREQNPGQVQTKEYTPRTGLGKKNHTCRKYSSQLQDKTDITSTERYVWTLYAVSAIPSIPPPSASLLSYWT